MEAQAICSFLDEALDSLFNEESRFIDDIHKESPHGLHLCFVAALERMERARDLIDNETAKEGNA